MLLLELGHVDDGHVLLAAVEQVGQRDRRLGLADAARCRPAGTRRSAARVRRAWRAPCGCAGRCASSACDWPMIAPLQQLLERQDGVDLVRHHLADGNARSSRRPPRRSLCASTHDVHQRRLALQRRAAPAFEPCELGLQLASTSARGHAALGSSAHPAAWRRRAPPACRAARAIVVDQLALLAVQRVFELGQRLPRRRPSSRASSASRSSWSRAGQRFAVAGCRSPCRSARCCRRQSSIAGRRRRLAERRPARRPCRAR